MENERPSPDLEHRLRPVFRIGLLLARSGAAAFRVRAVVERAARALGFEHTECVVTPTSMLVSVWEQGKPWTRLVRLRELGVNMSRMRELDRLSRELKRHPTGITAAGLAQRLDGIERTPHGYPRWLTVPALGLSCAAFCGAIGGNGWQMAAAFVGAALGHVLRLFLHARHFQLVTLVVGCSFASSVTAYGAALGFELGTTYGATLGVSLHHGIGDPGRAMLASVLYLVPGVPLVTSLLDIIHGDYEAGLARGALATLVVACLGVGVLAAFAVVGRAV